MQNKGHAKLQILQYTEQFYRYLSLS